MNAVDLFAGCGGMTEGASAAGVEVVWAANHNPVACDFYHRNHPRARTVCQDLHQADWSAVPEHDILLASPCCQGHSPARGKDRPHHDTQRSTAWAVVSCAEAHRESLVVVENVPSFLKWDLYPSWLHAMTALGYAVAPHIVDAADHGVPQNRVRLFLVCTRSRHPLELALPKRPHVSANSFIQWDRYTWSPIDKPGRSKATLERIAQGRVQHGRRFVAPYYGSGSGKGGRSIDRPIGTIPTVDRWSVIDGDRMRMLHREEVRVAMGFRASYHLPTRQRAAVQLLGNAVPPQVIADILIAAKAAA